MAEEWVLSNTTTWEQIISRCPLDFKDKRSPLEFLENHVKNNPDGIAFCYPNRNFDQYINVSFENLVEITERIYCNLMKGPLKDIKPGSWITVAMDYSSDSFFITLALLRADMKQFYLDQFINYQTMDNLITEIQSPLVYISANSTSLRSGDKTIMKNSNRLIELERFILEDIYSWPITTAGKDQITFRQSRQNELDEIIWAICSSNNNNDILHPIYMTNRRIIIDSLDEIFLHQPKNTPKLPNTTDSSQSQTKVNSHVEYLYDPKHKHLTIGPCGDSITLLTGSLFSIVAGITVVHPLQKSVHITPQEILNSIRLGHVSKINAYPDTLCALSEFLSEHHDNKLSDLKDLDTIICARHPIPNFVVKSFTNNNIKVESCYRSARTGLIMWTPTNTEEIGVLTPLQLASYKFELVNRYNLDKELFELSIPSTAPHLASGLCDSTTTHYKTGDLFYKDSNINQWMFWGRENDLITHIGGMKTNPGLIERELAAINPCVRKVCVIGDGMNGPIMLIELTTSSNKRRDESITSVIKSVEFLNEKLVWCNQSKITGDNIYVLQAHETLTLNSKGTVEHQGVIVKFDQLIKQINHRC